MNNNANNSAMTLIPFVISYVSTWEWGKGCNFVYWPIYRKEYLTLPKTS